MSAMASQTWWSAFAAAFDAVSPTRNRQAALQIMFMLVQSVCTVFSQLIVQWHDNSKSTLALTIHAAFVF